MKRHWQRRLAMVLLVCMAFTACGAPIAPQSAWAEMERNLCGDFAYTLVEGGACIVDYTGDDGVLTIPDSLDGYPVVALDKHAFSSCESLTHVVLPNSLKTVEGNPFRGCASLAAFSVSPDHATLAVIDGVLYDKTSRTLLSYPMDRRASFFAVPEGIAAIGDSAFSENYFLQSVVLPSGLTTIGVSAFFDCCSLRSVALPDSLVSIGSGAFRWSSLDSVSLPDSLISIDGNPFSGCSELTAFMVSPDHPVYAVIDGVLYEKESRTLVSYPAGKPDTAFSVPDGIVTIGEDAFSGCQKLADITLPEGLTAIERFAFYENISLANISLPEGIRSIGNNAFLFCDSLNSITLPESLSFIAEGALLECGLSLMVTVTRNSYAHQYVVENGLNYTYIDANDWLLAPLPDATVASADMVKFDVPVNSNMLQQSRASIVINEGRVHLLAENAADFSGFSLEKTEEGVAFSRGAMTVDYPIDSPDICIYNGDVYLELVKLSNDLQMISTAKNGVCIR